MLEGREGERGMAVTSKKRLSLLARLYEPRAPRNKSLAEVHRTKLVGKGDIYFIVLSQPNDLLICLAFLTSDRLIRELKLSSRGGMKTKMSSSDFEWLHYSSGGPDSGQLEHPVLGHLEILISGHLVVSKWPPFTEVYSSRRVNQYSKEQDTDLLN